MASETGEAAFPVLPPLGPDGTAAVGYPYVGQGISVRDFFAAKAMQGLLASNWSGMGKRAIAADAYSMADAMLKERVN